MDKEGINVLSVFDGMSCGQIALERADIKVNNYYASEIDKHSIQVTQKNYPNTIQLGDVRNVNASRLPFINMLIGGSPCQGFSFAGKQLNFKDERSVLFFEYLRILNEIRKINPNVLFILENVEMKYENEIIISRYLGVNPCVIDSALLSAQNRVRNYWTNINQKTFGLFGDTYSDICQPKNKGIFLKDVLENGVVDRDKSFCIDANYWKGTSLEQYLLKSRRQIVFTERRTEEAKSIRKKYMRIGKDYSPRRGKILIAREDDKCNCLTASLSKEHILLDEQNAFRKLTPLECERLQTVPDGYTEGVSKVQRYKMLGNGWTVDVIVHILKHIQSWKN